MKTYEKDEIIRELLKTIEGLRAENKDLKEKLEKQELPTKPTRTMGGRTFVRGTRSVPGVIQNCNEPF